MSFFLRLSPQKIVPEDSTGNQPIPSLPFTRHRFGEVTQRNGHIILTLSFPSPEKLFLREDADGIVIGTDLRRIYRRGDELDSAGITSILTYGSLIPPLSPFREIRTLSPGFRYTIQNYPFRISKEPLRFREEPSPEDASLEPDAQCDRVAETLDRILTEICPSNDPVLLFSGGVDSSLLASRVAAMGWTNAALCHCTFGPNDPERTAAEAIAKALGLQMDVVHWTPETGFECMERAMDNYTHPFADYANVPSYTLLRSVAQRYRPGRIILDGSGADGLWGQFGKAERIRKLYSIPVPARYLAGLAYASTRWIPLPPKIEHPFKLFRKSILFPDFSFFSAQNPLAGIAYPGADVKKINRCLQNWILPLARTGDLEEIIPLTDVAVVSAGRYAPKNVHPLEQRGFTVEFPYMHPFNLNLALQHGRFWPGSIVPKAASKRLLNRNIPPELVYRKKMGFTPPQIDQFAHPRFLEYIWSVFDENAPLRPMINPKFIERQLDRAAKRKEIAENTYAFLWATAFLNAWLSQLFGSTATYTETAPQAGLVWA